MLGESANHPRLSHLPIDSGRIFCHNVTGYRSMTRRSSSITIRDVARRAGVSVATVSRYINQNVPVSEKLSGRIQQVMDELNYVPQATARHLALRKTQTVGLLVTNLHHDFFVPLLAGIERAVSENGYNLLVASYRPEYRDDYQLPLGLHNTDGALVFADSLSDEQIRSLYRRRFPMVLVHRTPSNGLDIPFVTVENQVATHQLVDHLISVHGRRRIIFMRGPEGQEDSHWRELGYRAALADHNIPFDEALTLCGHFERELAYVAMKSFLQNPFRPEFDAVFAGDDDAAMGVYKALKEAGLGIPEEVSVTGFDDLRMSAFLTPALTTVRAPTEEVGRVATEQLIRHIRGEQVESEVLLPTSVVIRQSCGCP
jgi:LacI family transcriptional regulator